MKDLMRRHEILQESIIEILNKQVQMEAQASSAYLAMAAWCDIRGYSNSAALFFSQSDDERMHQMKIFKYLLNMEAEVVTPAIAEPQHDFGSLKEVFEKFLEMEITVSDSIHEIMMLCDKLHDKATEQFMGWFVQEQIEEEYVARKCLELFDLLGHDKIALAMFEDKVLNIKYEEK